MKALIFDMDGLMIDSERLYIETEKEIARGYGKEVSESTLWKMMGRRPIESMRIFVNDLELPITPKKLLEIRDNIMLDKYKNETQALKGLFEIIEEFYPDMKLAIATGAQKKFLDIVIDKLDIRNKFTVLQSSDEIKNGKPDPEIYLAAIARLGLKPDECIVLEDSSNGALAGKRAGCFTIGVKSEYNYDQDFSFVDYFAKDLIDAMDYIKKLKM